MPNPLCQSPGVRYGPPGGKRLVYFVDDMNMALVDKYDTQSAVEIMRQSIDYRGWFEKTKIFLKARTQYKWRNSLGKLATLTRT